MAAQMLPRNGELVNLITETARVILRWRPLLPSYSQMLPLEHPQHMLRERYMMIKQVICAQASTSAVTSVASARPRRRPCRRPRRR